MGLYSDLEKKYYDALDAMDAKGIPVYSVVDVFEKSNIPTFPIFLILLAAIVIAVGFVVLQLVVPPTAQLTIQLANEDDVAIANKVLLVDNGTQTFEGTTNSNGEATFSISPYPATVTVSLKDESGFESSPKDVTIDQSEVAYTYHVREKIASFSGIANLVFADSKQVVTKNLLVTLSCSGNDSFHTQISFANGSSNVSSIPSDCGQLLAVSETGRIMNSPLNPLEENLIFEYSEQAENAGTLLVTVLDAENKPLSGKNVSITASDSTATQGIQVTAENGVATFPSIHAGIYLVYASDPSGAFAPAQSKKPVSVEAGKTADANVQMIPGSSASVVVRVTDAEGKPVNRAEVELRKDNQVQGYAQSTDESGEVSLSVSSTISYDIQVDHPDYFIALKKGITSASSPVAIVLSPTGPDNQTLLHVIVQDETNQPISGAVVVVTDAAGKAVSDEQITGQQGDTSFFRLAPGSYQVVSSRPGFGSDIQPVTIKVREVTESVSTITIGSGTLSLQMVTESNQPAGNGLADVFNAETNQPLIQNIPIQSDGTVKIPVRADQIVYVTARISGKAATTVGPFQVAKDATTTQTVYVLDEATETAIELQAIFDGTQTVDLSTQQLSAGKTYQLQYALRIPSSQSYAQVVAHIRSDTMEGPTDNVLMENDVTFFSPAQVKAPFALVSSGISFSPPQGQGIDLARNKNDQAKWINFVWSKPTSGTILISIPYTVRDFATTGQSLELLHRLETKTGTKLDRFPVDDVLAANANAVEKQGLYAKTLVDTFKVGVSAACSSSVCASLSATDLVQNIAVVLSDTIESENGSIYGFKGNFTTQKAFIPGLTTLRITNADGGLELTDAKLQLGNGRNIPLTAGTDAPMGLVGGQETFALSFTAKTAKEGTSSLNVQLVQDTTVVWEKVIRFSTKAGFPLSVSILPKAIVANADNHVLVIVKDSSDAPVTGAVASVFLDNVAGPQAFTNSEGKAEFTLSDLAPGSVVVIRVQKLGFAPFEQTLTAGNDVLLFDPNPLMESFTVDGKNTKTETVIVRNATNQALTITAIKWPTLQNYATVKVTSDNIPVTLEPDGSVTLSLEFKTTAKGQNIVRPLILTQNATMSVVDIQSKKRYTQNYPVNLSIGLNGFTDSADCFSVSPGTWKLVTSGEKTIVKGEMTNNCTVDEEAISLLEARGRIDWQTSNPIGTFSVQSQGPDARGSVTLSDTFQAISGTIPKGGKVPIQFTFTSSSIPTGTSQAIIEIAGINRTEEELQPLLQKIAVDITVNNVYACVQVTSVGKVEVVTNPIQLGLDLYQNNAASSNVSGNGTTSAVPSYIVPTLPSNFPDTTYRGGFIDPYQGNYQSPANPAFNNTVAKSAPNAPNTTNQIQVTNSCTSPVDITLGVPEQVSVNRATVTVKPKESEFITVQSGYKPGQFDIKFFGKASGSSAENATPIASVAVNVRTINPNSLGANCISLSTNQFAFNNFPGSAGAFPAQVINRCYTQGVRLADGGGGIQLFDNGLSNYPQGMNAQPYYGNYLQQNQGGYNPNYAGGASSGFNGANNANYYQNGYLNNPNYANATSYQNPNQYNQYQTPCNCVQGQACPCGNGGSGGVIGLGGGQATPYPVGTIGQPTQGLATGVIIIGRYTKGNSEVIQFAVQKNSGYQQSPPIPAAGQSFASNGPLGAFYGGYPGLPSPAVGGAAVTNPGTLSVNFTDAWGNAQSKNFPVLLTDIMPPPGFAQQLDRRGNPNLQEYQECVPSSGLNITMDDAWFASNCVNEVDGQPCMEAQVEITNLLRIDRDHCSSDDYIDLILPRNINQDGVEITIDVKDNRRHPVVVHANRTVMTKDQTIISQDLSAVLIRPVLGRDQDIEINAKFTVTKAGVKAGDVTIPGTDNAILLECKEKGMGESFVPRISYNWKWDDWGNTLSSRSVKGVTFKDEKAKLEEKTPTEDKSIYYADGAQFAIELAKKMGTEEGLMEKINAARAKKLDTLKDFTFGSETEKNAVTNSDHLYRFLKKQITLTEIKGSNTITKVFFVSKDGMPIARPLTTTEKSALSVAVGKTLNEESKNAIKSNTKEMPKFIKALHDAIKGMPTTNQLTEMWNDTVLVWEEVDTKLLGIEGVQLVSKKDGKVYPASAITGNIDTIKDFYLIQTATSFDAFVNGEEGLYESCFDITAAPIAIKAGCDKTVEIYRSTAAKKKTIDLALLQKYANFKLVTAIRNEKNELSTTERDIVLEKAAPATEGMDVTLADYYQELNFGAFMMRDSLSADFWNDFKRLYNQGAGEQSALFDLIDTEETSKHRIGKKVEDETELAAVEFKQAGKYQFKLLYQWESIDGTSGHEKDSLTIDAELVKDDKTKLSSIYDVSLDGPLGISPISSGMLKDNDGTREGYGSQLNGDRVQATIPIGTYGEASTDVLTRENLIFSDTKAYNQVNWSQQFDWSKYTVEEREKGRVLSVKKTDEGEYNMIFTPSYKVVLDARLRSNGVGAAGWDYQLDAGRGVDTFAANTINWKQGNNPFTPSQITSQRGFCGQSTSPNARQIKTVDVDLLGVAFVPPSIAPGKVWAISTTCATPELSLEINRTENGTVVHVPESHVMRGIGSGFYDSVQLNANTTVYTLQSLLEHANTDDGYCFVSDSTTTQVVWN